MADEEGALQITGKGEEGPDTCPNNGHPPCAPSGLQVSYPTDAWLAWLFVVSAFIMLYLLRPRH